MKTLFIKAQSSRFVSFCLLPLLFLSFVFYGIIYVRKKILLHKRRKRATRPGVVTVGNVSFGGTGKTPFIVLLLKKFNNNVAYVSRGYRRKEKKPFVGKGALCTAALCGDEAVQIARRFPQVCMSIAHNKWEAVERVGNKSLIFLDDGLQRYDVPRNIEIATVDVTCPDGYGGLFPRGFLREPLSRLKEVDYIVLTNIGTAQELVTLDNSPFCYFFTTETTEITENANPCGKNDAEKLCEEYSSRFSRPTIACELHITRFFDAQGKTALLPEKKIALFSAIASPERVRALMERYGFTVVDHLVFSDHVDIDVNSVYTFCDRVRAQGATAIIGTEKDFVKRELWPELPLPLFFSEVDFEVVAGKEAFERLVSQIGECVWN